MSTEGAQDTTNHTASKNINSETLNERPIQALDFVCVRFGAAWVSGCHFIDIYYIAPGLRNGAGITLELSDEKPSERGTFLHRAMQQREGVCQPNPVSYTHLTLPTKA